MGFDIFQFSCIRLIQVIKNINDFKEKIKNIVVPKYHTMASLDIVSLFSRVPIELVQQSFKKRWS